MKNCEKEGDESEVKDIFQITDHKRGAEETYIHTYIDYMARVRVGKKFENFQRK